MQKPGIFRRTAAESYAAGQRDSRHFMSLYRAYLQGASDAAGVREEAERENGLKLTIAAMAFALIGWFITMYFVFK